MLIKQGEGGEGLPAYDVSASFSTKYPFKKYSFVQEIYVSKDGSTTLTNHTYNDLVFKDGFESEAQFYVFVGVISFLYVIAAIVSYAWYKKFESTSEYFATYFTKVDFVITAALTFLWFLSVTLWSAGFSALRRDLDPPYEFGQLISEILIDSGATKLCSAPHFTCMTTDSWSKVYGSVVFGYLCILLFGVNCWYCFKDTEWHAEPEKLAGILHIRTDQPQSPAPGNSGLADVNLEVGDTATIQPGAI